MVKLESNEIRVLISALEFFQYEMNKTDDMDLYRSWKSLNKKVLNNVDYHRGTWSIKEKINE